jgi:hypothetical protein
MKRIVRWKMEAAERICLFCEKPEIVLTVAETLVVGKLNATWTTMKNWGAEQVDGGLDFRTGTKERRIAYDMVLANMQDISGMAKGLEAGGLLAAGSEMFRMPRSRSFLGVAAAAQAFADNAEPVKALFIAGGLPATFVEDMEAMLPQLDTASGTRQTGLIDQSVGTAGLEAVAAEALRLIQQLRPMMRMHLKNQPALLTGWNNAARVWRVTPGNEEDAGSGTEDGTGTEGVTAAVVPVGGSAATA